jgi:hypothetical protein
LALWILQVRAQARAEPEQDVAQAPERQAQLVAELPVLPGEQAQAQVLLVPPVERALVVPRAPVLAPALEVPRELRALLWERALVRAAQLAWVLARVRVPASQVEEARPVPLEQEQLGRVARE